MKALSVCQPWAWGIVHGLKTIENRFRRVHYRGPLVIHASRSRRYCRGDYSGLLPGLPPWDALDYGALVGVVELVDCVPLTEVEGDPFAVGPWCWLLRRPRRLRPVPFAGQVSFFDVPDRLIEALPGAVRIDPGASGVGKGPRDH
jgi:hypothetical protein